MTGVASFGRFLRVNSWIVTANLSLHSGDPMFSLRIIRWVALTSLAPMTLACSDHSDTVAPRSHAPTETPHFTPASGNVSTLIARSTFSDPNDPIFKVKRISDDWHLELKATAAFDIAIQSIVFQPGGQSGWHTHPGPVFVRVVSGTTTEYKSDDPTCTPIVHPAGSAYVDDGEHAHIARNESGAQATVVVTYLVPPGAPLRLDAPAPGNCPF
jgi:quercetin dioxygenase-like cupin family protein